MLNYFHVDKKLHPIELHSMSIYLSDLIFLKVIHSRLAAIHFNSTMKENDTWLNKDISKIV